MRKFTLLESSVLGSAVFVSLAIATPALAQGQQPVNPGGDACQAPADGTQAACPDSSEEANVDAAAADTNAQASQSAEGGEAITVVGSRIRRNQFNTADPVQLITRDDSVQAGFNSAAEILQSTQVTGGSGQINNLYGGFVTAGGPGANTVSLRGLGTSRTLVLLNGRRIAPAGTRGQVGAPDLNVLPNAIIDRIEILNTGASSIYGSDAIAGVINIVTRSNVNGLSFEAQHNVTEEGGATSERYSVVAGYRGDRFQVSGSAEYYNRDELRLGQRDFTRCQTQRFRSAAGAPIGSGDFIDPETGQPQCYTTGTTGESGVTINTIGTPNLGGATVNLAPGAPAGYTGVCNRFRPDVTAGGALPGYECVGGGTLPLNLRDTFAPVLLKNALVSPARTWTGFLQGSYEIGVLGDAEVFGELLVNRRISNQLQSRQFTIDYPMGSPLIPVGLRFPTSFLPAQTGGITGTNPIGIRVFSSFGNYRNEQTVDYVKAIAGMRGRLFGDWNYDGHVSKAWSDGEYLTELLLIDRLTASLDVVQNANGTFSCRQPLPGCVAAPTLTPSVVNGVFPQAWRDYVVADTVGRTKYRESLASFTVDGPLFSLPGGEAAAALGVEYRKDSLDDTPDENSILSNLYGFTSSTPTRGTDSVWEVYGELELPLLADMPFAHALTVNGSARYTEYASYGGDETWKIGGLYAPTDWLSFRGSYGTSYRAPALFEQFLGSTSGFQSQANDPCNNYGNLPADSVRRANCASLGLAPNYVATSSIQVNQVGGAQAGLAAETSRAWTVGGVLQPRFGDAFGSISFSADYFNILVDQGVQQLSFLNILTTCYDTPGFADPLCNFVTRETNAPNRLIVTTGYVNVAESKVAGWDFNLRYSRRLGPGSIRLTGAVTKFDVRYNQILPTSPKTNTVGTIGFAGTGGAGPEWTGTFDASYETGPWTLRYGLEWVGSMNSSAAFLAITEAQRALFDYETDDYFLHSASVRYNTDRFGIILGVRNLANKEPPFISASQYNRVGNAPLYSGFDPFGRQFFVNVSTNF